MPPKTRFVIHVPGRTDIGCDTAIKSWTALNDLKNAEGVTVADQQTGMKELSRGSNRGTCERRTRVSSLCGLSSRTPR